MKHFTVHEANALLPELRRLLANIRSAVEAFEREREHLPEGEEPSVTSDTMVSPGHFRTVARFHRTMLRLNEIGCEIKDVAKGLVDFPTVIDGEEACLCWREGEETVRFWHRPQDGFEGRQPLPEEDAG